MQTSVGEMQKPPRVWAATNELRWFAELFQMPPRLQQKWSDQGGNIEWRDVPSSWGSKP